MTRLEISVAGLVVVAAAVVGYVTAGSTTNAAQHVGASNPIETQRPQNVKDALFRVDVEIRNDHLQVHGARFVVVEDGVELSADVGSCVASQLDGSDDVPLVTGMPAFVGEVEYRFTVDFGAPDAA